ncbi:MAG: hypothetical protein MZV63_36755 [Marinilabiliales bacterium]|nr:hypothetical protein [Marinilabiliales bacterium]
MEFINFLLTTQYLSDIHLRKDVPELSLNSASLNNGEIYVSSGTGVFRLNQETDISGLQLTRDQEVIQKGRILITFILILKAISGSQLLKKDIMKYF